VSTLQKGETIDFDVVSKYDAEPTYYAACYDELEKARYREWPSIDGWPSIIGGWPSIDHP